MEQTVKERLIEFLKYKGYSQGRLEKELGWSNGYINSVRNNMGSQKLQALLGKFPDLSQNWLINGYGEMIKPEIELGEDGKPYIKKEEVKDRRTDRAEIRIKVPQSAESIIEKYKDRHTDAATAITDTYIRKDFSVIDKANERVLDFVKLL